MIRVMFRWDVTPGKEARFVQLWEEGTRTVQESCRGSLGSILVRSTTNPQHFFAIARWQDQSAWDEGNRKIMTMGLRGPMPEIIDIFEEESDIGPAIQR
jgi:heme-degrading monooxygenase HmoA